MKPILPASAYVRYAYVPARIFLIPGILAGLLVPLVRQFSPALIASGEVTGELYPALWQGLAGGLFLAALCWVGFWWGEIFGAVAQHRGWLIHGAPPPPGEGWSHFLMAKYAKSSWVRTNGKLYAARGALAYVAAGIAPGEKVRQSHLLHIEVDATTTFTPLEPLRGPSLLYRLGFHRAPRLEIRTGSRAWELEVPKPEVAAQRLREVVWPSL